MVPPQVPDTVKNGITEKRRVSHRFVFGVAELFEVAGGTVGFARVANAAAMPDELVRELNPPVLRDDGH